MAPTVELASRHKNEDVAKKTLSNTIRSFTQHAAAVEDRARNLVVDSRREIAVRVENMCFMDETLLL